MPSRCGRCSRASTQRRGELRCAPLWRADPRSKLAAAPLLEALKARAGEQGIEDLEPLAKSKALKGDVRAVQAACRAGGSRRVKVERLCRKVLGADPRELYGEQFERAWQHKGKRVNERVQSFDHCFSVEHSISLGQPPFLQPGSGRVAQLGSDGTLHTVVDGLMFPTIARFGPDGALYVANFSAGGDPGEGQILRIDLAGK